MAGRICKIFRQPVDIHAAEADDKGKYCPSVFLLAVCFLWCRKGFAVYAGYAE
jgi:hypothetical protein